MSATRVALVPRVFHGEQGEEELGRALARVRAQGAAVAILPELPLDPWMPVRRRPRDDDAEAPDGPRHRLAARAAARAGVALISGAIVREGTGRRHNTALALDAGGQAVARYRKAHLPEEPGFWETSHYEAGSGAPGVFELAGLRAGIQICSDVNRPTGSLLLGAAGAQVIFAPRATEPGTYDRWKLVLRANALTACCHVLSVNRPPEAGANLGGPSVAIGPDGTVLAEGEDLMVVDVDPGAVTRARTSYPGYLPHFPGLYARGWAALDRPG
jgi:N-carbamoylputrescine amidase